MNRLVALVAAATALTLSACEEPARDETIETYEPAIEEPVAPTAEEAAAPAAATALEETPPADQALPTDERTSEETVKPESETLFY